MRFIILHITLILSLLSGHAQPVKVACVGNSVTYGYKLADRSSHAYPAQLQQLLGDDYRVENFGHSGATLLEKGHNPYRELPALKNAIAFEPDIVVIHLGLNDTDPRNWPYYRDQFTTDYIDLIRTFRQLKPDTKVWICRMTPIFSWHPRFKSSTRVWYDQVQQEIERVAKVTGVSLIDLNTPLFNRPDLFPNEGDLTAVFPPEREEPTHAYSYDGKMYGTHPAVGAGIYLRHVWGSSTVPAFYDEPQENHTAYAWIYVWSPKKQTVGLWATTQDYSRSESDLPPPQGEWDYKQSRIFLNDKAVTPPIWENNHTEKSNEITLKNENFIAREPIPVELQKGWNKVLLKLPIGRFCTPEVRLQKWMFTFVFVTPDGSDRMEELIYNPDRIK